jgi:spore coat polysaccharide biosynthesis protein SpsF (cytidylyltransferase family)
MKVVTIIQARTTSQRLRNKVLMDINGRSLLDRVIDKALQIKSPSRVWVATSSDKTDDAIELLCDGRNIPCHRGSLHDVRSRFYEIAKKENADVLVRITADNPLTEPTYADQMIQYLIQNPIFDYVRMKKELIPVGTGSEVFTFPAFEDAISKYNDEANTEHVTTALIEYYNKAELTPENEELIAREPYFVGVDTMEQYIDAIKLFRLYGETDTLSSIIRKINQRERVI